MFKHYTMNQVVLPLDLEIKLKENDIAFAIPGVWHPKIKKTRKSLGTALFFCQIFHNFIA